MKEILKDILRYCESDEEIYVAADSYYRAFQIHSDELMRNPLARALMELNNEDPERDAKRWPSYFGLEMRHSLKNDMVLIFRKL